MAKQLIINDPASGMTYTLEYTRKTVTQMERQGFIAEDVTKKPLTMLPALFVLSWLIIGSSSRRWLRVSTSV